MITRDVSIDDCTMDVIENSVDGVRRSEVAPASFNIGTIAAACRCVREGHAFSFQGWYVASDGRR